MIFNINLTPRNINSVSYLPPKSRETTLVFLQPVKADSFAFTGRSQASDYDDVFEYLASGILDAKSKKYGVDGSMLSASHRSEEHTSELQSRI